MTTNKIYFFVLVIFLASCSEDFFETTLEIDPPEYTERLAVTAFGDTRTNTLEVLVTKTIGLLEDGSNDDSKIDSAEVKLFKDDVLIFQLEKPLIFFPGSGNNYEMPEGIHVFEKGATYKLEVSAAGYPVATATTLVPQDITPTSLDFEEDAASNFDSDDNNGVNITFRDPAGENFYETDVIALWEDPDTGETGFDSYYAETNDPALIYGISNFVFSDITFNDKNKTVELLVPSYYGLSDPEIRDIVYVNWRVTSEAHFLYNKTVERYFEVGESPFASPTQIYSNVENGIGVFSIVNESYIKLTQ